jgi:Fic family protein
MALANRNLLAEIDKKFCLLQSEPEYATKLRNSLDSSLRTLSDLASWWNSGQDFRKDMADELETTDSINIKRLTREGLNRVHSAWSYLRGAVDYSKRKTHELLSPNILLQLAETLDPKNDSYRKINEKCESFKPDYEPPSSSQVLPLIEDLCAKLRRPDTHPVNMAAYAHLGIVAIQPFRGAHKRLGRLVQDSILKDANLPVATVYPGEKVIYYDLLRSGVTAFMGESSAGQVPFFDFIAGKVNVQLDRYIDTIFIQRGIPLDHAKKKKCFGTKKTHKEPVIYRPR